MWNGSFAQRCAPSLLPQSFVTRCPSRVLHASNVFNFKGRLSQAAETETETHIYLKWDNDFRAVLHSQPKPNLGEFSSNRSSAAWDSFGC